MNFRPLNTQNSYGQNWGQVNDMVRQLNKEQTVKTFKQPGGNAIIQGKLPYNGGYGTLYYDTDNIPGIVIGILPSGNMGLVIAKPSKDVLDVFN
jgi:hypothetical protein